MRTKKNWHLPMLWPRQKYSGFPGIVRPLYFVALAFFLLGVISYNNLAFALGAASENKVEYAPLGVLVTDISEFDRQNKKFKATFWLWTVTDNADSNVIKNIEFSNAIEIKESTIQATRTPMGIWITRKVRGLFRHSWDMSRFPFDNQTLNIAIEATDRDYSKLRFITNGLTSVIDHRLSVRGWDVVGAALYSGHRDYRTNFGDPRIAKDSEIAYAKADINITLKRIDYTGFWKLVAAAFAAAGLALASFGLHLDTAPAVGPRFGLLAGSVFADVISMRSSSTDLGAGDYNTLVDQIHILVLFYIAVATVIGVYTHWHFQKYSDSAKIKKIGNLAAVISTVALAAVILLQVYRAADWG
jgi:hypothetical protein